MHHGYHHLKSNPHFLVHAPRLWSLFKTIRAIALRAHNICDTLIREKITIFLRLRSRYERLGYSTVQLKLVGGEGEMKFTFTGDFPLIFFHRSFHPFFTVATGEIRGIRIPKEEYVFRTWEKKWKRVKSFSSDFSRIPQIYNSSSRIMWNPHF